ncbi:3-oxo-5-alpha-steroid 4-dehydrogenase-domain-containing protein [Catenaria anguillulae PL171]|uniref:3-oxo-5-alpha-steroid 4-dehydrogenase-domain-containing protein n=1 Tax=Catenaria anguillulae PL171 TaxID=765915 RepID=A0A1Y2I0T1_9FUNG|nr:3-oxo-5-alpha-steroid 4-dehydrogenase-domain-containing protein [Catenaria anguillulae PL171]
MKISIVSKSGKVLADNFELDGNADAVTILDLKKAYHKLNKKATPERQRWTFGKKALDEDDKSLASYKVFDKAQLTFKDLGPQIGWKTVFLIEYAGPLFIYPFFYGFGHLVYGTEPVVKNQAQEIAYAMLMFHFFKRELETLFVHRFSHGTMPFFNVFKNSFHYWILSGVLVAWHVFRPNAVPEGSEMFRAACVGIFMFGQVSNFMTHWTLRSLRKPGSKERKIPYGYGFDLVSCPNYFFETVSWFAVLLLTQSWAVLVFFVFAVGQMYIWAVKKHKNYIKEFKYYPKGRTAMFPFIA